MTCADTVSPKEILPSDNKGKNTGGESDNGSTTVIVSECEPSTSVDAASVSTFMEHVQDMEDVGRLIFLTLY